MQTKNLHKFLWFFLAAMAVISIYIYGLVLKANGDNVEHLHTSWLVWRGYIPYKDFFQHHNPLTWYLSAPIVAYFINDFSVFSLFNIFGVITLYLIAYYQGKIIFLDLKNKTSALFLGAILVSAYSLLWSTDYRPDTFMFLFFYMGLYCLFLYRFNGNKKDLIVSFFYFFISFMFTQKVLMHLVVPGIVLIYWLFTNKVKLKDVVYASIVPLLLLLLFIWYLYSHDALKVYWLSNYAFNTYIPKIFEEQRIIFPPHEYIDFYLFLPIAFVASIYFIYKGTELERIFSLMFFLETGIRFFYFSAFLHYVIFWLMLSIILTVMFLTDLTKEKQNILIIGVLILLPLSRYLASVYGYNWTTFNYGMFLLLIAILLAIKFSDKFIKQQTLLCVIGILYLLVMAWYSYFMTYRKEIKTHAYPNGHEIAFKLLTPCDYAINGYYATYNLKAKDPGYYSILLGQIDVLGEKSGIAKRDNLNELIRIKKPKLISAGVYWDTYWEQRGKKIPAHTIDSYLLKTYYDYSGSGDLYVLKPQYQRHGCVYNGKDWIYMD